MKNKLSFLLLLSLFFLLTAAPFQADETRVFAPNLKPVKGNWVGLQNVSVCGVIYPNAYVPTDGIDYVIARQYRFFVTEIGLPDNAIQDSQDIFFAGENNKILFRKEIKLGDPITQIRLPIDEYVRLRIYSWSQLQIVFINPYFVK